LNILLVDDDVVLAKGTAKLLQRLGNHQVQISDAPVDIIQLCQSGGVDLVVMDVNLPGAEWEGQSISGADLARYLKEHPATSHLPIILLTAYAMLDEREKLLKTSQADAFLAKPILDYEAMLNLMERLVTND
jgi:CheY-like chemotaxis protein